MIKASLCSLVLLGCPQINNSSQVYVQVTRIEDAPMVKVMQGFIEEMDKNNLDGALNYVVEENRNFYRRAFTATLEEEVFKGLGYGTDLKTVGEKLKGITLQYSGQFGNPPHRDFEYSCRGNDGVYYSCPVRFIQNEEGEWYLERL